MIDYEFLASGLAIVGMIIAEVYYIHGTLTNRIKPHIFSWVIWGTLMLVGAVLQFYGGAEIASVAEFIGALLCLSIAVLAYFRGEKNITRSDWGCFCFAVAAIPLWLATDEPLYAALLITSIDVLAFVPTFRKTWLDPETETRSMYLLSATTDTLICLSITPVTLAAVLYPASGLITNGGLLVMMLARRYYLSEARQHPPLLFHASAHP